MRLILIEKKPETQDVTSFIFRAEEPFTFKPGQFFHYVLHHEPTDERGSDRWFTVSAAPFEGNIRITTRFAGDTSSSFKKALFALKEGETIEISDIDGDFILEDLEKEYVFIAGGIGVTPFRSMLTQLNYEGKVPRITLLYANKDPENVPYKEELETIAEKNPQFSAHYIFSPEHIDEAKIKEVVPDISVPIFYVSGPEPMVENMGTMLKEMGIPDNHIKQDWFPGYPLE